MVVAGEQKHNDDEEDYDNFIPVYGNEDQYFNWRRGDNIHTIRGICERLHMDTDTVGILRLVNGVGEWALPTRLDDPIQWSDYNHLGHLDFVLETTGIRVYLNDHYRFTWEENDNIRTVRDLCEHLGVNYDGSDPTVQLWVEETWEQYWHVFLATDMDTELTLDPFGWDWYDRDRDLNVHYGWREESEEEEEEKEEEQENVSSTRRSAVNAILRMRSQSSSSSDESSSSSDEDMPEESEEEEAATNDSAAVADLTNQMRVMTMTSRRRGADRRAALERERGQHDLRRRQNEDEILRRLRDMRVSGGTSSPSRDRKSVV